MDHEIGVYLSTPLQLSYPPTTYSFSSESHFCPSRFSFGDSCELNTCADLVNNWNIKAVKFRRHTIAMNIDFADSNYIYMTNAAPTPVHLWAGTSSHTYLGTWAGHEIRRMLISDFIAGQLSDGVSVCRSPIIITHDTPVFEAVAYLYRKGGTGAFYPACETITIPAGYYHDVAMLVAVLNSRVQMRGERNGFIYHFITNGKGRIGVEATHRQPEPSVLTLTKLADLASQKAAIGLGATFECQMSLPLRTAKRMFFEEDIHVIM